MAFQQLTHSDLENVLESSIDVARKAGALILQGSNAITSATFEVGEKKNSVDLVTEYDVAVEELVKKEFKAKYPEFGFIGEESYSAGARPALTDAPTFCVDPIDGTTNFVHGFPFACISIGLLYRRRPVLGVIYNPFLDHLYYGVKGGGSYLVRGSAAPLKLPLSSSVKPLLSLHDAVICVEWGSDRSRKAMDAKASSFVGLAGNPIQGIVNGKMAHGLRSIGSAALSYCLVAQGSADIYWEVGCWPWDVSAGIVIAEEAGGVITGSRDAFIEACDNGTFGEVTEAILTGRKYIVVRAARDTPNESGREAQKRIVKDFYDTVEDMEPN